MNKFIIYFLIFGIFTTSCKQKQILQTKTFSPSEINRLDETYHHYRENFFKYFLDEGNNRFNGCVPEKIFIKPEKIIKENYLDDYLKIKFADATIYASLALMFLSNDISFQLSRGNKDEAIRSGLLLRQVMDGIIYNDKLSAAGIDGFFLRDTVSNIDGITIESDFINSKNGGNEMSGSQSSALYYGFYFSLKTLCRIKASEIVGLEKIICDIKDECQHLTNYLLKHKFKIQSEIHPGKKVRRGPYVLTLKWIYMEINRYWNNPSIKNPYCKLIWTYMYKGTNWLCKLNQLTVKKYDRLKASTPKNYHGKTYAPFYIQMLQTALFSIKQNSSEEKRWQKYVWRYQNGLAVGAAIAAGLPVDPKLKNMVYEQLFDAPTMHLPNNFSKDHQGWNEDNRWIRLLHRNLIPEKIEIIQIYNGLDFLCAYSAVRQQMAPFEVPIKK